MSLTLSMHVCLGDKKRLTIAALKKVMFFANSKCQISNAFYEFGSYVDGACKNGKGAVGGYTIDESSTLLNWSLYIGTCLSPHHVEGRAVLEVLHKCHQYTLTYATIYMDFIYVWRNFVDPNTTSRHEWCYIIDTCRHLM